MVDTSTIRLVPVTELVEGEPFAFPTNGPVDATEKIEGRQRLFHSLSVQRGSTDEYRLLYEGETRRAKPFETLAHYSQVWAVRPEPETEAKPNSDSAEVAESLTPRSARLIEDAYLRGMRDGEQKAISEAPTVGAVTYTFTREDAVALAARVLTGTQDAATSLVYLAQRIEQYVNGNEQGEAKTNDAPLQVGERVRVRNDVPDDHSACRGETGELSLRQPGQYAVAGHWGSLGDFERIE